MKSNITYIIILLYCFSCSSKENQNNTIEIEQIRQIHDAYVQGWLEMDEERILGLFDENARIQPNGMGGKEGMKEIKAFWFPDNGSTTTINDFKTKLLSIEIIDTLAVTTQTSYLDWDYKKDSTVFGMIQRGVATTLFRKQEDNSWKIWRQMWTDIMSEHKATIN